VYHIGITTINQASMVVFIGILPLLSTQFPPSIMALNSFVDSALHFFQIQHLLLNPNLAIASVQNNDSF
jgi:hypothetical protein